MDADVRRRDRSWRGARVNKRGGIRDREREALGIPRHAVPMPDGGVTRNFAHLLASHEAEQMQTNCKIGVDADGHVERRSRTDVRVPGI
jgi:hypothetical protein